MKTLGIIGGIGPESTIHYYRAIIAAYRDQRDGNYPSIIINSVSVKKLLDLVGGNELDKVTEFLAVEVERLARAGADFALLASNTPHIVFDQLQRCSSIPLVSIVQATAEAAKAQGLKKVGLFGTRFTMQARFYPEVFTREEIAVVLHHAHEQDFIHEKYIGELLNNIIRPDTRDRLLTIVKRMKEQDGIQGLILGGTELPLILSDAGDTGLLFLDTTQIHARAAAQMLD
jgi:aspartate racemase